MYSQIRIAPVARNMERREENTYHLMGWFTPTRGMARKSKLFEHRQTIFIGLQTQS